MASSKTNRERRSISTGKNSRCKAMKQPQNPKTKKAIKTEMLNNHLPGNSYNAR
jgi:hypothetical protein